jgi:quercetin dioxygenase-like cupin family protein
VLREIAAGTPYATLDVFGPNVEFVSGPDDPAAGFWAMRGVLPPGVLVPLHSHGDAEDFFILAGTQQVLIMSDQGLQWTEVNAGDDVHIPAGVPHAHRNVSDDPAVAGGHHRSVWAILPRSRPVRHQATTNAG